MSGWGDPARTARFEPPPSPARMTTIPSADGQPGCAGVLLDAQPSAARINQGAGELLVATIRLSGQRCNWRHSAHGLKGHGDGRVASRCRVATGRAQYGVHGQGCAVKQLSDEGALSAIQVIGGALQVSHYHIRGPGLLEGSRQACS